jgi:hypothetical protein
MHWHTYTFCFKAPLVRFQVAFWRHANAVRAFVRAVKLLMLPFLRSANRSSLTNSLRASVMMLAG